MSHVFISYSTADTASAKQVCEYLEKNGISCWMAPRNIDPGASYASQIVKAIEHCGLLVVLTSQVACRSEHVSNEVGLAVDNKKTVIPFRLDDVPFTDDFKYYLGRKHWIDGFAGMDHALPALVAGVREQLGMGHAAPTPAPTRVEEKQPEHTARPLDLEQQIEAAIRGGSRSATAAATQQPQPKTQPVQPTPAPTRVEEKRPESTPRPSDLERQIEEAMRGGSHSARPASTQTRQPIVQPHVSASKPETYSGESVGGTFFASSDSTVTRNRGLETAIKILMVISCIYAALYVFPLLWFIPLTAIVWKKLNDGKPISRGMKICVLLFVNLIAGICLFCRKDS